MTRDELERCVVRVAVSMSTVVHRRVMGYILPKARQGWIEVPEVEYPLNMADAFEVLDDPEVQKWIETLLGESEPKEKTVPTAGPASVFFDQGKLYVKDEFGVEKAIEGIEGSNPERERALVMAALGASFGESFGRDENGMPLPYAELREAKIAAVFRIVERAYPTE